MPFAFFVFVFVFVVFLLTAPVQLRRGAPSAATGCYAVTLMLSRRNSGAKSAPFAQTSVWKSGWT